jgi:hypothetical protein
MKKFYGHPGFYELIEEIKEIHSNKNKDYAGDNPLSNFMMCERMGIPAWKGVLIRISDKFSRLCSFANTEEFKVKDESVEDTLKDLAVYSLICLILFKEKKLTDKVKDNIDNEIDKYANQEEMELFEKIQVENIKPEYFC